MDKPNEKTEQLFQVIRGLTTAEECSAFFRDLCTVKELQDMSQRLDAALLLAKGYSYQKIVEETGLSTATIGRVSRCLQYGEGGYSLAISILDPKNNGENNGTT